MNIIYEAILAKKHKTAIPGIHSWREFRKVSRKKIFLFGATASSKYFLDRYGNRFFVHAVLDNNVKKQNTSFYKETYVQSPEILQNENKNNIVVIVTVTNCYKEICNQLHEMGVKYIFVLCKMEQKRFWIRAHIYIAYCFQELHKKIERKTGWNSIVHSRRKLLKQCWKYPISPRKIILFANGKCIDHEKYICQALLAIDKSLDLVWILNDESDCPVGTRGINIRNQRQIIYELATAKVWLNRDTFPIYIKKRKGQIYIQTKHWSSITLKKFYFDTPVFYKTQPWAKYLWRNDVKMYDFIMIGSEFDKRTCESGFQYHGKFAYIGSPRTDALFKTDFNKEKVFAKYRIKKDSHVALYAPTFRVSENDGKYVSKICKKIPNFSKLSSLLGKKFGGEWIIGLRFHPFVSNDNEALENIDSVINMSQYDDIQELLAASDIIITDYSSLMFEPAMVGKKVFLFTPDLEDYCKNERELWFDIRKLPFSYAMNENELYKQILEFRNDVYQNKTKSFFDEYGVCEDGHASERAAEFIIELLKG